MIIFCGAQKILFPINILVSSSIEKIIIPYFYRAPFVPPNLLNTHQI